MSNNAAQENNEHITGDPVQELRTIANNLEQMHQRGLDDEINGPPNALKETAEEFGEAFSKSWLGYHAYVYYRDFRIPPPGMHFSKEWGIQRQAFNRGTEGDWVEYSGPEVIELIHKVAGNPDLNPARAFDDEARDTFRQNQTAMASILDINSRKLESDYLRELQEQVGNLSTTTQHEVIQHLKPQQSRSRDSLASGQGHWTPPHISVLSEVVAINHGIGILKHLAELARQARSHIARQAHQTEQDKNSSKGKVFIGHGRSLVWFELKDFLTDRLELECDEFNRISTAGIATTERLQAMLKVAGFAFLIMTAEDEQFDGKIRARENVVHEVGLFQGSLGFEKAIVLLEDECEQFSNITGLGQIRFPKGNIGAAFEKIREVLEREEFLSGQAP